MKVGELGEFGLLDFLGVARSRLPFGWIGPGDDAAVLPSPSSPLLLTSDLLAEGTHFRRSTTSARDLGYKALAVNVSDVAAMGGTPLGFTLSLGCPADLDASWLGDLYGGLGEAALKFQCPLVGGDTSCAPLVFLSVALVGAAPPEGAVLRSGAGPGDHLYVSGFPGESAAGLRLLETGKTLDVSARAHAVERHRRPCARVALGAALGRDRLATAMIDVSDGLLQDLGHILSQSGTGATLSRELLPISEALAQLGRDLDFDPTEVLLTGGEDYELLFTVPPDRAAELDKASLSADTPIHRIGFIDSGPGVRLVHNGEPVNLPTRRGFDHFK